MSGVNHGAVATVWLELRLQFAQPGHVTFTYTGTSGPESAFELSVDSVVQDVPLDVAQAATVTVPIASAGWHTVRWTVWRYGPALVGICLSVVHHRIRYYDGRRRHMHARTRRILLRRGLD